ncbi:MAG: rod shape-determining protein RodA [Treponema sp.]|jgi:rod shape determining protein RodA|nr:rod shape-determining protein RodA [Treponema sp.]
MRLRDFLDIDFPLFLAAVILTVFGILFIYSSGVSSTGAVVSDEYKRQIVWAAAGIILALVLSMVNFRRIYDLSMYLYFGTLILLVYTCLFGHTVSGARAWIGIGSFGIQPSEFAKITTILFFARYLDSTRREQNIIVRFVVSCLIVFVPMALILLQPDFGTSLVFIPILLTMTFIGGITLRFVVFLGGCIILTGVMMVLPLWQETILRGSIPGVMVLMNKWFVLISVLALSAISLVSLFGFRRYGKRYFYWICYTGAMGIFSLLASFVSHKVLKDYQIMRLIVFLDPNVDPRGSGWHIIQSMTAIGSGGFMGKGFLNGTQSHYRFLPQQSTDFIFSIFTEEWGLLGGLLVIALFMLICLRLVKIVNTTSDSFGAYIAAGLTAMYSFHFLINVGMAMGVMPITGIPLHFMSYGGSALISAMAGIGIALSIHIRRFNR